MARRGAVQLVRAHDPLTGGWVWVAVSRSSPGLAYLLREGPDGRWLCSCPRFAFRGACPHTEALYVRLAPPAPARDGTILTPS